MLDFWKFCFCYLNQCLIEPRDVRFLLELNLQNPSSSSEINVIRLKFTFYFPRNQQSELQNRSIRQKNFITRSSNLPSMKNFISKQFPLKILTKNSWKTWTLLNNTRLELQIVDYSEQLVISPVIAFCIGIVENPRGMKLREQNKQMNEKKDREREREREDEEEEEEEEKYRLQKKNKMKWVILYFSLSLITSTSPFYTHPLLV